MADKIVQLQDKQGNNVFPITGGMAADSVTTDMIQDGAVTSEKVDFATYSTEEQLVGTWIDGKKIYRRTIFGSDFANQYRFAPSGFTASRIIKAQGVVRRSDYPGIYHQIPSRIGSNLSVQFANILAEGIIIVEWGSGWNSSLFQDIYITVYYTKD